MIPRRLALLLIAALGAAGPSCLSPTLPLPPPEEPDAMEPSAEDPEIWVINGTCIAGALVTVFNEETGAGAIVEDSDRNGRYSVEVRATRCDTAWVSQEAENETSGKTVFVIQEQDASGPDPCK
jgi:hypothetical protein